MASDLAQYIIQNDTSVCLLDCEKAFEALTEKEKLYAHYISQASFCGGLAVLHQTSPEAPGIYLLLQKLFRSQTIEELEQVSKDQELSEDEFKAIQVYAAAFYANMGNYKSFGDSKFIPNLPKEKFEAVVMNSAAAKSDPKMMRGLWDSIADIMYSLADKHKTLGFCDKAVSAYYSSNCDMADSKLSQEFMDSKSLSPYNTRLFKTKDESGTDMYDVRIASVDTCDGDIPGVTKGMLSSHKFTSDKGDVNFKVSRGDYSEIMGKVIDNLKKAQEYSANDNEKNMLAGYIECFKTGSIPSHKDGSRFWIRNQGPIVESYIGFIESYRDPYGARGEFEGFAAVVNKEMSEKFGNLVENAVHFLTLLPWPEEFEKDKFLRPDFTALDVLSFGGSGIPAGINIPNYDDIRQEEGFKNVSLSNVLTSGYKDTKITFLKEDDKDLFTLLKLPSFEVQVGLHELLGHGSGKLFVKKEDGSFNFDSETVKDPLNHANITSWYNHNETWDSKFTVIASPYEECRAECVGLYLCLSSEILRIFGHEDSTADDIIYINWLNMVRAGLQALEFYSPELQKWRQAHMHARFVILRVLLEAGQGLVEVKKITGDDGQPDAVVLLDRSKINAVGKPAIGDFLTKLQVYKSTADFTTGKQLFDSYSDVTDKEEPHFLSLREVVLARKVPRKLFVQHHTYVEDEKVKLKSYEPTATGLIESFKDRFADVETDDMIYNMWQADKKYH